MGKLHGLVETTGLLAVVVVVVVEEVVAVVVGVVVDVVVALDVVEVGAVGDGLGR